MHPRRGFVSGSVYAHRKMFGHLAKAVGARALLVNYRLLPEGGVYPVPVNDVEAAYAGGPSLVATFGLPPTQPERGQ